MVVALDYTERWAKIGRGEQVVAPTDLSTPKYSYYQPLAKAADDYVHWAQTPHERIYLGFAEIDSQMRGIAPAELLSNKSLTATPTQLGCLKTRL